MGVPLEERREGRTSITPEFMEELESADTCGGTVGYLHELPRPRLAAPEGEMVMGAFIPTPAHSPLPALPVCPPVLLPSVEFSSLSIVCCSPKCTAWELSHLLSVYHAPLKP